jgi:hypothetical protein
MATAPEPTTAPEQLLASLRLLDEEYADYRPPPTRQILDIARAERQRRGASPAPRPEQQQARHELNLAATLLLQRPGAAASLDHASTQPFPEPGAALVLACLMHLTHRQQAARFWWKYAAGCGNPTAAYCLYLAHRAAAEFHDAEHWRRQTATLRAATGQPKPPTQAEVPPLPARSLRDLLAECHRGDRPHLSTPVQSAVDQLGITDEDTFDGKHPAPSPNLIQALTPCR